MKYCRQNIGSVDDTYAKRYYIKNRERLLAQQKEYQQRSKPERKKYHQTYGRKNREKLRVYQRKWVKNNPHKRREYERRGRQNNPNVRLKIVLRNRLRKALRRSKNYGRTKLVSLLGCTIPDFRIYLESKFEVGMSWANYGSEWHIDHIIPIAIFDLSKQEHQKRCFHFSNLQPLWAHENMVKHASIHDDQFRLL